MTKLQKDKPANFDLDKWDTRIMAQYHLVLTKLQLVRWWISRLPSSPNQLEKFKCVRELFTHLLLSC